MGKRLTPEWFEKFILYTNNILKYGKVYMEFKEEKENKTLNYIASTITFASLLIAAWSGLSIIIVRI